MRVRPVCGAHLNTGAAAVALVENSALEELDSIRQVRNATETLDEEQATATRQDVAEAINAASAIVDACAQYARARV